MEVFDYKRVIPTDNTNILKLTEINYYLLLIELVQLQMKNLL